jgi:hypothetical protein
MLEVLRKAKANHVLKQVYQLRRTDMHQMQTTKAFVVLLQVREDGILE